MRALAVGAVIAAHAGVSQLGGGFVGVDLFFVLSGFLITDLLVREWGRGGRISLPRFWARRVRRLLPASSLVLLVTVIASAIFMPINQRANIVTDVVWSALFSANWRFAQQQTDYFAQDRAISPVQHFWSLGVEEQFYVAWPFLVVVCGLIAAALIRRGYKVTVRTAVGIVAAVVVVASFAYSMHLTDTNQPYAYFGTPARAWQLGLGALLAAAAPAIAHLGRRLSTTFAIAGLTGFITSVLILTEDGTGPAYPGTAALLPTISAALLIAAGIPAAGTIVGSILSWRPLVWLGDISYSLYLWHFPLLIIGMTKFEPAGWLVRTGLVLATVVAAALSTHLLETPIRTSRHLTRRTTLSLGMGATLIALVTATAIASPKLTPSSANTVTNERGNRVELTPSLANPAPGKALNTGCAIPPPETIPGACDFGKVDSDKRVILLGDSHAGAIFQGMQIAATKADWRLTYWAKPACNIAGPIVPHQDLDARAIACNEFKSKIYARTIAAKPDLVVLSSAVNPNKQVYGSKTGELLSKEASYPLVIEGWRSTIKRFTDAGIPVAVIHDWPRASSNPVDCLAKTRDARRCTFQRSDVPNPEAVAVKGLRNVSLVDVDGEFCPENTCTPVVGNLLVFHDTGHFTRAYSKHLAPLLQRELLDAR